MSIIVSLAVGSVAISSQLLVSIAVSAAASMGLEALVAENLTQMQKDMLEELEKGFSEVEISIAKTENLKNVVAERCSASFVKDNVIIMIRRDVRGNLRVMAKGEGIDKAELNKRANDFLGIILQQVAYSEVVTNLKLYGLKVKEESRESNGVVKVRIGRG